MAKQIYYEDVKVGDDLPSFSMDYDPLRIVLQVSGSQDYYPGHHDVEFTRGDGRPDVFAQNSFLCSLCTRVVTDWCGDEGWLRKFRMEIRRMTLVGDRLTLKGKVTGKRLEDSQHLVELEVWGENPRDGVSIPCRGEVILPSRSS